MRGSISSSMESGSIPTTPTPHSSDPDALAPRCARRGARAETKKRTKLSLPGQVESPLFTSEAGLCSPVSHVSHLSREATPAPSSFCSLFLAVRRGKDGSPPKNGNVYRSEERRVGKECTSRRWQGE